MIPEPTINELCRLQGLLAERIRHDTGYDVVFIYGIAADNDNIQCGAVYTEGMTKKQGEAVADSARHFINQCVHG